MLKQFSYSQMLLALAITFLAYSIGRLTLHLPEIITIVDKTTNTVDSIKPKIDDIINEVALIRVEVGKVRTLAAQQTPAILSQVQATLPVVQNVIDESEHYSQKLPQMLAQIAKIEQQIEKLQTTMPDFLKRVDAVVNATNNTTTEISRWRPHSSRYLEEIEQSKVYIPKYLLRVENIVIDAKSIGSEASSGIVSGFIKGVFKLPFEMVAGLTNIVDKDSRSAKNLTSEDVALMQEKSVDLLNDDDQSKSFWNNVHSGNRGTITKTESSTGNDQQCFTLTFNNHFGNEQETLKETMCKNDKGLWRII